MSGRAAAQLKEALDALSEGRDRDAHQLAMAILGDDPRNPGGYFVMAQIAHRHGNIAKAEEVLSRALGFAPDHVDCLLMRAQCLLELSRHEEAKGAVAVLDTAKLASAHQHDTLGVLHSRLGQHSLALPYFEHASALAPQRVEYQYNLASCRQFAGDFDAAEAAYERAIALDPRHYRSHSSLSQLRRQTEHSNHLERLTALWNTLGDSPDARLHIGHALAKEYEDLGDYGQAMQFLEAGKAAKREQVREDRQDQEGLFAALTSVAETLAAAPGAGFASDEPIFIVGMPRTGTTLVERILSSHPAVTSAGELANFSLLVKRQLQTRSRWVLDAETLARAGELDFVRLGRDYLDSTRHLTGGSPHFIDKMPLNFLYIPMILRALPGAKIVCLRRNPMDTCLSNYRQLFSTAFSYYNYAYSLQDTARFYLHFHRLMARLQVLFPGRVHELHYEALVEDPQRHTRALLSYCDLDWDPACLEFHRNTAPVATASSVQVREKLYRRGIDRWRHYAPWLGELQSILAEAGLAPDAGQRISPEP